MSRSVSSFSSTTVLKSGLLQASKFMELLDLLRGMAFAFELVLAAESIELAKEDCLEAILQDK